MPKPPPTHRFKITCEADVADLGRVMVTLAQIEGLVVTGNELVTEIRTFAKNTPGISTGVIEEWIKDHPTFKAIDVVNHFRERGNGNGHAAYPALALLVEKGILKKLGPGNYARADVKQLAAPKPKPGRHDSQDRREVDHREFVLKLARKNHGRFNTAWMKNQFVKDDRKPSAVSPTLARLMQLKKIRRVGDSEYVLALKAVTRKSGKSAAAVSATTGVTEVANG
jgi:hypothetical protein